MSQFDRMCRVTAGAPGATGVSVGMPVRIAFNVAKSDDVFANRIQVDIYNLTRESMNLMGSLGNRLVVEAGYGDELEVLAIGDITKFQIMRQPPDVVLRLEAGDGIISIKDTLVSFSFNGPISVNALIDKVAAAMGFGRRDTGVEITGTFQFGWAFTGRASDALDQLSAKAGVIWSVQNGDLQFTIPDQPARDRAWIISPATGLLSSPMRLEDVGWGGREELGWQVDSLLLPRLEPGGLVEIQSSDVNGQFAARRVTHVGDTHGSDWMTRAEVFDS